MKTSNMHKDIFASTRSRHYAVDAPVALVQSNAVKNRMHRYVNLAKALFRKGATSHGRTFNVCFIVKKSQVIAIGLNDYDRNMSGYNRRLKTVYKKYGEKSYVPSLHAEVSAILKAGVDDCSSLSFYCIRLDKGCHCQNSQPCANCMNLLNSLKAKNIYFYDRDMRICEMA